MNDEVRTLTAKLPTPGNTAGNGSTAWSRSSSVSSASATAGRGSLHCRVWSEVAPSVLGTELSCPNCGRPVHLNTFVVEADWRPIAAAWAQEK
ncbi:MAG: hypothetical protein HY318_13530 [Armatimonadetes bacterium]|nr:hypothetical protein [Armatimonadota bacterium]